MNPTVLAIWSWMVNAMLLMGGAILFLTVLLMLSAIVYVTGALIWAVVDSLLDAWRETA